MKNFIIFLITGILCTHCTQKYIKMDKDNLHPTGNTQGGPTAGTTSTPAGTASSTSPIADLSETELVERLFRVLKGNEYYFDDEDAAAFEVAFKEKIEEVLEEAKRRGIAKEVVNSIDAKDDETPLITVSAAGNVGLMELFLAAGADVNKKDADGETALQSAAFLGHTEAVKLLVERGATIDAADEDDRTALHDAASEGHLEIVKFLVEKDANIEAANEDGSTALLLAVGRGHRDVVAYLLEEGAYIEVRDEDGYGVLEKLVGIEDDEQRDTMEELLRSYKKKKEKK
ncbi:MAG: ankyrin repeat domain-containing protein [Cytophagales bacterium]|nr:ankyrin repeat domain-containing protein [Cytophagales bacterium]